MFLKFSQNYILEPNIVLGYIFYMRKVEDLRKVGIWFLYFSINKISSQMLDKRSMSHSLSLKYLSIDNNNQFVL